MDAKDLERASRCRGALTRDLLVCADMYPGFVGGSHALRAKQVPPRESPTTAGHFLFRMCCSANWLPGRAGPSSFRTHQIRNAVQAGQRQIIGGRSKQPDLQRF
jgi:hypothetical protein